MSKTEYVVIVAENSKLKEAVWKTLWADDCVEFAARVRAEAYDEITQAISDIQDKYDELAFTEKE